MAALISMFSGGLAVKSSLSRGMNDVREHIIAPSGGRVLQVDEKISTEALRWDGLGKFEERQKTSEAQAECGRRNLEDNE